jgi:hypothetical protein
MGKMKKRQGRPDGSLLHPSIFAWAIRGWRPEFSFTGRGGSRTAPTGFHRNRITNEPYPGKERRRGLKKPFFFLFPFDNILFEKVS